MIFKFSLKLHFVLSVIIILIINSIQAKEKETLDVKEKHDKDEVITDDYYLVVVNHKIHKKKNSHEKRHEREEILDILVSEINNLIMDNKDTYDNPSELEEIEQVKNPDSLRKRGLEEEDDDESNYAFVISSLEKQSVIVTYLSEYLVPLVEDLPNVKYVIHDFKLTLAEKTNEELKRLPRSCGWNTPCVKGNTYNHLSIISQDKYNDSKKNASYDNNYYFPASAGKGVDIFILDTGFNFNHPAFSNKDEREAKCIASTSRTEVTIEDNELCFFGDKQYQKYHGNMVADIAAGLINGVATTANIYGINVYTEFISHSSIPDSDTFYASAAINALTHIRDYRIKDPHKTVINISSIYEIDYYDVGPYVYNPKKDSDCLYNIINEMSNDGVTFVVASGNQGRLVDDLVYPCSFNNTICVGSIDNAGINEDYKKMNDKIISEEKFNEILKENIKKKGMATKNYRQAAYSNYGKNVNIYAPGAVKTNYYDIDGKEHEVYVEGTSFSSPIVAGIAATLLSEFPDDKNSMLVRLQNKGTHNIIKGIEKGHPNVLANIGKHITYSQYDKYNSCGNPKNNLCSKDDK